MTIACGDSIPGASSSRFATTAKATAASPANARDRTANAPSPGLPVVATARFSALRRARRSTDTTTTVSNANCATSNHGGACGEDGPPEAVAAISTRDGSTIAHAIAAAAPMST